MNRRNFTLQQQKASKKQMEDKNINETVNERYVYHQKADATKSEHQNCNL